MKVLKPNHKDQNKKYIYCNQTECQITPPKNTNQNKCYLIKPKKNKPK